MNAGGLRRAWREVRAIALLEALDGVRSRRQLLVRGLTPIVLFVCVLAVTIALRGADTRTHPERYRIAVQGDFASARATLDALLPERLVFLPSDDARLAPIENFDAGLLVPAGLDALLAAGGDRPVPVEVFQVTLNPPSRAAAVLVESAFVDLHARQVRSQARAAGPPAGSFSVEVVNVERTVAGTRSLTSQVIPGLVCLQAALLVAGTANRLVSRRTTGLLTAQLLLPVSRRNLARAKGLGELLVGLLTATPVVFAVLAFGAVIALREGRPEAAVVHVAATAVALVLLAAFTTAVGVIIGTAARTQEQVSLATGGAVIFAALVATTIALSPVDPPAGIHVVPFAGLIGALRLTLNGGGSPGLFVVACVSTTAGAWVLSLLGGRALDGERLVMRNG